MRVTFSPTSTTLIINKSTNFNYYFTCSHQTNFQVYDSGYLISQLIADRLIIPLYYPYHVSPLLLSNLPTISLLLGNRQKSITKEISHTIKKLIVSGNPTPRSKTIRQSSKIAQYFTLGLDSFYTLLNLPSLPDYLFFIEGYDIGLDQQTLISKVKETINQVANSMGVNTVFLRTNLREVSERLISWEQFHGLACAAAAINLAPLFGTVYSNNVNTLDPVSSHWGSGKHLEPLFSTEYLTIKSFGHDKNRFEKALALSKSPHFDLVLKYVRPCWKETDYINDGYNCCRCEKCARTYLSLVAATGLKDIEAFPHFNLHYLDRIELHHNPETMLSWQAIHHNLVNRFGSNSSYAKKSSRFISH